MMEGVPYEPELLAFECLLYDLEMMVNTILLRIRELTENEEGVQTMESVRVFDLDNKERDMDYARTKYGVDFERAVVEPGKPAYRLKVLWEKTGHHSLITKVLDRNGKPKPNVDVAFRWPDAPDPPDPPTTLYPHDWHRNFVHGPTNPNGDVGPAMGTGAYHGEGEGGPHEVWIRDPNIPSDICMKLGMLAGTFHDHFDQTFQEEEGTQPMPDEGKFFEVDGARSVEILPPEGVTMNHLSIKCSGEPNFYDTIVDLRVGEHWENPNWVDPNNHYPAGLHHYNIPTLYNPEPNETTRKFWVIIRHAGTEGILSEPMFFRFNRDEGRRYSTRVEWRTDDNGGNGDGPTPPPKDILEALNRLNDTVDLIFSCLEIIANAKIFRM